jgi:small-conductance mechanosensitive channel
MTLDPVASVPFVVAEVTWDDWVVAGSLIVGALLATMALRQILRMLTRSLRFQDYVTTIITRLVGTLLVLVAIVYALRQLEVNVGPILGALGLGGIVLAFSLQHTLSNLVGSILLHARRPIRRGDQIETNDTSGTVVDINGRAVVLVTFDGEMVYIPNLKVLEEPLLNRTVNEYRRTLLPFEVSYDADLRQTQRVVVQAIRAVEALEDAPPPDVLVTGFHESGVGLVARFWHPSEELTARWATSEVAITIRQTLAAADITIPYPQRVLHLAESSAPDLEAVPEAPV